MVETVGEFRARVAAQYVRDAAKVGRQKQQRPASAETGRRQTQAVPLA